jgi:hypothetical protein
MIDTKKLEKEFEGLPEGWIALLESTAEQFLDVNIAVNGILTRKGFTGIILSSSRPYSNLLKIYQKNNIDTKKLVIIDCVSKSQGAKTEDNKNVLFIDNVGALTQISLSIAESIKNVKGKKYLYMDSMTTMLIHNQAKTFVSFIHSVLTKLRMNDVNGLMFSIIKGIDEEVRNEIAQLCDKVVKV